MHRWQRVGQQMLRLAVKLVNPEPIFVVGKATIIASA
jgi:hypothetical protein